MITFTKAYQVGVGDDAKTYPTLREAQLAAIRALPGLWSDNTNPDAVAEEIVTAIVDNSDKVVDILTTKASSRPKARKANGGVKKRKPTPEAVNAALQDMKQ